MSKPPFGKMECLARLNAAIKAATGELGLTLSEYPVLWIEQRGATFIVNMRLQFADLSAYWHRCFFIPDRVLYASGPRELAEYIRDEIEEGESR